MKHSENSLTIYKKLYYAENETTPEQVHDRVAKFIADDEEQYNQFKFMMDEKIFFPNSPTLIHAGCKIKNPWDGQLGACFLPGLTDDMDSIIDLWATAAKIYASGAGIGVAITNLREKGSPISSGGTASGTLGYISVLEEIAQRVRSGGRARRSAALLSFVHNHPEIMDLINLKSEGKFQSFNISCFLTDEFLNAMRNGKDYIVDLISPNGNKKVGEISAKIIWDAIIEQSHKTGDPGILFADTVNRFNPFPSYGPIRQTNPCVIGDTLILVRKGYIDNQHKFYPIKDLVDKDIEIWNGFRWTKVTPQKTGENEHLYKIDFRNVFTGENKILYCTDYHRFLLENGSRIKANQLSLYDKTPIWKDPFGNFIQHEVVSILSTANYDDVYCFMDPWDHTGIFNGVLTAQCGEVAAPEWNMCTLGHINLTKCITNNKFDFDLLIEYSKWGTIFLDNVIDKTTYVHPKFEEVMKKTRLVGLGILGWADTLFELGIAYDSDRARILFQDICRNLTHSAFSKSIELAKIKGSIPIPNEDLDHFKNLLAHYTDNDPNILDKFDEYGIRNGSVTCIAPTGSCSLIAEASASFEPCFGLTSVKTLAESGEELYFTNPVFERWLDKNKPSEKKHLLKIIAKNKGSLKGLGFSKEIEDIFVTAHDIDPINKIKMQSSGQRYISLAISSTCNLPNSATKEDVEKIFLFSHEMGVKGCTIYRDGSHINQPISFGQKECKEIKPDKYVRPIVRSGKTIEVKSPEGSLYVTINKDDNTGKIIEVFLRMGKKGNKINLLIDALSRCISKGLQSGMKVSEFSTTLRGNKDDSPFYFRLDENQEKPYQAESIVDAIGIILDKFGDDTYIKLTDNEGNLYELCPSCGKFTLSRAMGCRNGQCISPECGYTSCG